MARRAIGCRVAGLTRAAMRLGVDGGWLHLETTGRGSPILLLHGWPLDHRLFEPQIRYLERYLHVIGFDRRGFGRSEAPPDLGRELDDIERILEALGLRTVHLLGMSQGARVALRFAVAKPGHIRSLILQAPVVDGLNFDEPESERIPVDEYVRLARAGCMDEVRRRWLAHPMMALAAEQAGARRRVEDIIAGYEGKDLLDDSRGRDAFPHDVLERLARLDMDCLILTGAHDTAARREHARRVLETMPRAREIVFRHSGHLSNLTEAQAYNRHVAEFCATVDGDPRQRAAADSNRSVRN